MQYKIPTAEACDLANVSRSRFNEAVAAGFYMSAPEAEHGKPRMFGEVDLICLVSYGMRLEEGETPRRAGLYTYQLYKALASNPDADAVTITIGWPGDRSSESGAVTFDPDRKTKIGKPVHLQTIVNVAALRGFVRKHLNETQDDVVQDGDDREAGYAP